MDLLIRRSRIPALDGDWIQLLVENAHRWRSVTFIHYVKELAAELGPSPLMLEYLELQATRIPNDCKLFNLIRPNLRKLFLMETTIPHNFDPRLGLEDLHLRRVSELMEDGTVHTLSTSKFHEFLQTNPNLRIFYVDYRTASPNVHGLQSVELPKLEKFMMFGSQVETLGLFRASHCLAVHFRVRSIKETPPLGTWATLAHTLRRVERLQIDVGNARLFIRDLGGPYKVDVLLFVSDATDVDRQDLVYSMLKDILDEAEKDGQISARVELALFATRESGSEFDLNLEVLELLQTPVSHSPSRQSGWRIPNLDTIRMLEPGLPYNHLRAFIQARSNGSDVGPITDVSIQRSTNYNYNRKEVLDEVMSYTGEGNDG